MQCTECAFHYHIKPTQIKNNVERHHRNQFRGALARDAVMFFFVLQAIVGAIAVAAWQIDTAFATCELVENCTCTWPQEGIATNCTDQAPLRWNVFPTSWQSSEEVERAGMPGTKATYYVVGWFFFTLGFGLWSMCSKSGPELLSNQLEACCCSFSRRSRLRRMGPRQPPPRDVEAAAGSVGGGGGSGGTVLDLETHGLCIALGMSNCGGVCGNPRGGNRQGGQGGVIDPTALLITMAVAFVIGLAVVVLGVLAGFILGCVVAQRFMQRHYYVLQREVLQVRCRRCARASLVLSPSAH